MIYNVIPINYAGGIGGHFLSAFICAARENKSIDWIFSEDGNAHDTAKDFGTPPYGLGQDLDGKKGIEFLINYAKNIPENIVVYPHGHYTDPDSLMKYFYKQIKIYVEPEQVDEATGVFMLKNPVTGIHFRTDPIDKEKYNNHIVTKWRKFAATRCTRLFNNCPDLEPRMLNVSWNDMLYNDPEILISKLYIFTEILEGNFDREGFAEWRQLTHKTVNRLRLAGLI